MKCQVMTEALRTANRFLAATTLQRTTLPILSHILLDAQNDQLRMAATNLNFWLEWTVAAEVEEEGKMAVSGKEWRALISSLDSELVHLEAPNEVDTSGRMTVRFGKSEYHLPILPADEFPVPTEAVWDEPFEVDGTSLAQAVRKVLFVASSDLTMGVCTGVHFDKEDEQSPLHIVATDTYRLMFVALDLDAFPPITLNIPKQPLQVMLPLWEKVGTVRWRVSEDKHLVAWEGDQWKATVTTLTGTFPNYRRVIPTEWAHEIVVKVSHLQSALKRMLIFRPTRSQPHRVILRLTTSDELELVSWTSVGYAYEEVGREVIPIEWRSEPTAYEIAFQHPYLAEFLSVVRESEVVVRFQESNRRAAVWQPLQDDRCRYIVMPMMLPGSEE
jgi:DNA polymerase-3 subunit beta